MQSSGKGKSQQPCSLTQAPAADSALTARILESTSEADRQALLAFLCKLVLYVPPATLATGPRGSSIGGAMGLAMQQMGLPTAIGPGAAAPRGPGIPGGAR